MAEFVELEKSKADNANSWSVDINGIDKNTFDLSVKNPNKGGEVTLRTPKEILKEMAKLDAESEKVLAGITKMIG